MGGEAGGGGGLLNQRANGALLAGIVGRLQLAAQLVVARNSPQSTDPSGVAAYFGIFVVYVLFGVQEVRRASLFSTVCCPAAAAAAIAAVHAACRIIAATLPLSLLASLRAWGQRCSSCTGQTYLSEGERNRLHGSTARHSISWCSTGYYYYDDDDDDDMLLKLQPLPSCVTWALLALHRWGRRHVSKGSTCCGQLLGA